MQLASIPSFLTAYSQSDFLGKGIFWSLFVLSTVTWFLIIYKLIFLVKIKKASQQFKQMIKKKNQNILEYSIEPAPNPLIELYGAIKNKAIEVLDKNHFFLSKHVHKDPSSKEVYLSHIDMEFMESHAQTFMESKKDQLEKDLFILSTAATLAPFLGLLGTVWGILVTFNGLSSGGSLTSNSAVLSGLSTALTTTVLGLLIAIPALIFHNYFKNQIRTFCFDMQDFGSYLLSTIEIQYRKVDV